MGFLQRTVKFLREVRTELRKVIWPSRQQTIVFTGVVLAATVIVASALYVIDSIVGSVLRLVIR